MKLNIYKTFQIIGLVLVLQLFMFYANKLFKDDNSVMPSSLHYRIGDEPSWSKPNLNQDQWSTEKPDHKGIYWIRATYDSLENYASNLGQKELSVTLLGSFDLYVNGTLVAKNGQVGSSRDLEKPGRLDNEIVFSDDLLGNGHNVLALRVSNHYLSGTVRHAPVLEIRNYQSIGGLVFAKPILLFILSGVFITVSIYYLFLFFINQRRLEYLLFALFNGLLFLLILLTYSRTYWTYLYPQYLTWKWVTSVASLIAALLLPLFLAETFKVKSKQTLSLLSIAIVATSHFVFPNDEMASLFFAALIGLGITIWAIFQARIGAWESLAGLLIFILGAMIFDLSLFVGFAVLVFANLFSLSIIQRETKAEYEQSLLRSSRLETELLKKHLKPHFLMNTLTNIISLIEHKPALSVALIEALSEEYQLLNTITDKNLIPLEQELKLCRSHLNVMRIRHDLDYLLEVKGDQENILVPPAIIHTLLENGISHSRAINNQVGFKFEINKTEGTICLEFVALGKYESTKVTKDGTGFTYIKSRLEENYPGRWCLSSTPVNAEQWKTQIKYHP